MDLESRPAIRQCEAMCLTQLRVRKRRHALPPSLHSCRRQGWRCRRRRWRTWRRWPVWISQRQSQCSAQQKRVLDLCAEKLISAPDTSACMQASGLALPAASVADLAALAGLDEPVAEADAGPTMMSREARALFAAGDGEVGLRAWKVRCPRRLQCVT